jgi:hypothetical protein
MTLAHNFIEVTPLLDLDDVVVAMITDDLWLTAYEMGEGQVPFLQLIFEAAIALQVARPVEPFDPAIVGWPNLLVNVDAEVDETDTLTGRSIYSVTNDVPVSDNG